MTQAVAGHSDVVLVSIRAPREGSDLGFNESLVIVDCFNPRSP